MCWWYDCPEGRRHYYTDALRLAQRAADVSVARDLGPIQQAKSEPVRNRLTQGQLDSIDRTDLRDAFGWCPVGTPWQQDNTTQLHKLLNSWRQAKKEAACEGLWFRSLRPPQHRLGASLRMVLRAEEAVFDCVAFSPDAKEIAAGSDDGLHVWEVSTGRESAHLQWEGPGTAHRVRRVAWSPAGQHLAAGSRVGVRIWNARTLAAVRAFTALGAGVVAMGWSHDET